MMVKGLTLETAMKPSATSDIILNKQNRSKLEVKILPTDEGSVSSVKTHKAINT